MRRLAVTVVGLCVCSCLPRAYAGLLVARAVTEASHDHGWFGADRNERIGVEVPREICASLERRDGPIYVLIHGIGGEGVETQRTLPLLATAQPRALLRFRWAPWQQRDVLAERLGAGLGRLAACGPVVVIAHSAGGVVASLALEHVLTPAHAEEPWLTLITVASPLAGVVSESGREVGQGVVFLVDLGVAPAYAPPPAGVRVLHLRTHAPADPDMAVRLGHEPNDVRIGVPGARQIDLPAAVTHAGALVYVARRIADGSFEDWVAERSP